MDYKAFCDKCNKETIHEVNMFCRPGITNLNDKLFYCLECRAKKHKEQNLIDNMLNNINNNNFNKDYFDFDIDKLDKAMAQTPTTMPVINTIEELDEWLNRGELSESIEQLTPEQCKALLINNVDNWSDVFYGFYNELHKSINNLLNK